MNKMDESIHGVATGFFAQNLFKKFSPEKQDELKVWGYEFLLELYQNEMKYTDDVYAETGLSPDVKAYVRYNANKALMNLGYEALFPDVVTDVSPAILSALSPDANENHDFFSGNGSSYVMGTGEETKDDDWDF